MSMIFFVHVPKTAGTSFRIAAAKYFGEEHIYSDYGPHSKDTSDVIKVNAYEISDLYRIKTLAESQDIKLLTGHVPVQKYNPILSSFDIATFLRNPVEQVISHFEHYSRHLGYKKSFEEFVDDSRFMNLQSRVLRGLPLELYGFLGITERYNDSIDMFNAFYGTEFQKLSLNTKKSKKGHDPKFNSLEDIDVDLYQYIEEKNSIDMQVYNQALKIFDERFLMLKERHRYAIGFVGVRKPHYIGGVAYNKDTDQAVELEVLINNEIDGECKATELRPHLRNLNLPRRGYVGFSYHFSRELIDTDSVEVRVKETGQKLVLKGHFPTQ